jgi:beta-glucosidase
MMNRRTFIAASSALGASSALAHKVRSLPRGAQGKSFPAGFLWGAATAGHQVEGNNINSDCWVMENVKPTIFAEPSLDAANSFALWASDLDLITSMGLNTYRFSLEWPRIEPEEGLFSIAMLDHYKMIIDGCIARNITPIVTFNHYTTPRWFAKQGGWTHPQSPSKFTRFCARSARHLASGIGYATTLNEPNLMGLLKSVLPPQVIAAQTAMLKAAADATATAKFVAGNAVLAEDIDSYTRNLVLGHQSARTAIKAVRPDLPVGLSLAMFDDEAFGKDSIRDTMRERFYMPWLDIVKHDDFLGVQNYERKIWDNKGLLPVPAGAPTNYSGAEVYAPSLANAVRYAYAQTRVPIMVTEHGVGTTDDSLRAALIPAALVALQQAMDEGVPVKGYCHWSLIDNFEWIFGYKVKFGLHSVDPVSFVRIPKPSARIYGDIARRNAV